MSSQGEPWDDQSEAPSGVHRRLGRLVVMEPDSSARGRWDSAAEVHHVEFVKGPATLHSALRRPGTPRAISLALMERTALDSRSTLSRDLRAVAELGSLRVIIDVRRCDMRTALELLEAGYILCADDETHRGTAPRAAVRGGTMSDELADVDARCRLVKTVGATVVSDRYELSAGQYRVLRGLMDYDQLERLAAQAALSPSTVRSHARRIRKAMGVKTIAEAVRAAEEVAFDAAFAFGRLQL